MPQIGDVVTYIDPTRRECNALVTAIFKNEFGDGKDGLNLVLVSKDTDKDDNYGRQLERQTSIVHLSNQPAKANCWKEKP